jgi:hypothetical protein
MHLEPEKYQYIFEKYLRGALKADEVSTFLERLETDAEFALEFERYKTNRDFILKRELEEYEKPLITTSAPKNWGWVYLIISIFGFVLILDYYINTNYDNALAERRKAFLNRINIFKHTPEEPKSDSKEIQTKSNPIKSQSEILTLPQDSMELDTEDLFNKSDELLNAQLNPIEEPEKMPIQKDEMLADSIFSSFSQLIWDEKIKALSNATDSVLTDSAIFVLTQKSILRRTNTKSKPLFVEFWQSPVKFIGYRYNGRKLIVYGLNPEEYIMFLYNDLSATHSMVYKQIILPLISDQQFHKLNFK